MNENKLVNDYGSYIFTFPNAQLNKDKIAKEFRSLPGSKHFKLEKTNK